MKLYKTVTGNIIEFENKLYLSKYSDWDQLVNDDNLFENLKKEIVPSQEIKEAGKILAPITSQELWACGVTYKRSKEGREEESKKTGAAVFYSKVYDAERPEVFFKATAHRISNPGETVRIRKDSSWNVPEPELTLLVTSSGKIVGYTIGNDMSSRSIEGENPLYLPQAKTYDRCAGLGPCIWVTDKPFPIENKITLKITRDNKSVLKSSVKVSQMHRTLDELVHYVYRECTFPHGCLIMTGTGIVPPSDFTLLDGDIIQIGIEDIGVLINEVG